MNPQAGESWPHPYPLGRVKDSVGNPIAQAAYPADQRLAAAGVTDSGRTRRLWWEDGAHLDQGQNGTCVGNAFSHRLADGPVRRAGQVDEQYAIDLYLDATYVDPWPDNDGDLSAGTSGLAAAKVLKSRGVIDMYSWATSKEAFELAMMEQGSVCIGIDWCENWFHPEPDAHGIYWLDFDSPGDVAGGHEIVVNGEDRGAARPWDRIKNSWGTGWCKEGTVHADHEQLMEWIFTRGGDACVIHELAVPLASSDPTLDMA